MRYIDTGRRDPAEALGKWLKSVIELDLSVRELRWQTGFYTSAPLGLFKSALHHLSQADGVLRLLIGSNDGCTSRSDVEQLLSISGPPRKKRQIGIMNFGNAYFHPKTIHIVRADGSEAAYVGSANLTSQGVNGLHVEAGILLDTKDGDDAAVVAKIKQTIDWWFAKTRPGVHLISKASDLDALVKVGILDVPPPVPAPGAASKKSKATLVNLQALLTLTILPKPPASSSAQPTFTSPPVATTPAQWFKQLSASDAQRKTTGNQRGGITLVKAKHDIDANTYFRDIFFSSAAWAIDPNPKKQKKKREQCFIPFKVNFLGKALGTIELEISHEKGRASGQSNYTSELHLGPVLSKEFKSQDVTGRWLRLVRNATGAYTLSVLASPPE